MKIVFDTKEKSIKYSLIFIIGVVAVLGIVFTILYKNGLFTQNSGLRVGYVGNSTTSTWNGTYVSFSGTMTKKLKVAGDDLKVEVTTESGAIGITITDENGDYLYRGNDLETCSFSVKADGKVTIKVIGDKHQGSFSFK